MEKLDAPGRERPSTRRRELLGAIAAGSAAAVAGCSAAGDDSGETTAAETDAVVVGPGGEYAYEPATVRVAVGETVTWTWDSDDHNVVVADKPDGANWGGTDGDASTTYDAGHEYAHAFDVPGTYGYYCSPQRGLGMEAEVVVTEE